MTEYIEKQAVIDEVDEWYGLYPDSDTAREALSLLKKAIKKISPEDVRLAARGRWKVHYDDIWPTESTRECSECHEEVPLQIVCKFCPNCGADMRGAQDE